MELVRKHNAVCLRDLVIQRNAQKIRNYSFVPSGPFLKRTVPSHTLMKTMLE